MSAIGLAGFSATFAQSEDPWCTFTDHDEAVKRTAILCALGSQCLGRVFELASGNGSNSAVIAPRALRFDATEGTTEGTRLTEQALSAWPRARAIHLPLPATAPRATYDAIIIAELLYYLTPTDMDRVAREVSRRVRRGTVLVLAHHRIDFHDFTQHAAGIHERFLSASPRFETVKTIRRTKRWVVQAAIAR